MSVNDVGAVGSLNVCSDVGPSSVANREGPRSCVKSLPTLMDRGDHCAIRELQQNSVGNTHDQL